MIDAMIVTSIIGIVMFVLSNMDSKPNYRNISENSTKQQDIDIETKNNHHSVNPRPRRFYHYKDSSCYNEEEGRNFTKQLHCETGPAVKIIYKNGAYNHAYYYNNRLHRDDGPAIVNAKSNGTIVGEKFFIHGNRVTESDFNVRRRNAYYNILEEVLDDD